MQLAGIPGRWPTTVPKAACPVPTLPQGLYRLAGTGRTPESGVRQVAPRAGRPGEGGRGSGVFPHGHRSPGRRGDSCAAW